MIPMPIEHSQCKLNALHDSNVSRMTQLRPTSFIEYVVHLRFETSQSGVRCYKTSSREQIIQNKV